MRRRVLMLVAVLGGCDGVFKLTELPPVSDAAARDTGTDGVSLCAYETVATDDPGGDVDGDGVINSIDACPTVADPRMYDEDNDGTPDACDPCPAVAAAGNDLDCDLVGAACDPDETVAHAQTFFGFRDTAGLTTYKVTVADGTVSGPIGGMSGNVLTATSVSPIGHYEVSGYLTQIDSTFRAISIELDEDATGKRYNMQFGLDAGYTLLEVIVNMAQVSKAEPGAPTTTNVRYRLTLDYDGVAFKVAVTGDITASVEWPATPGMVRWGLSVYDETSAPHVEVDYMSRIAPE